MGESRKGALTAAASAAFVLATLGSTAAASAEQPGVHPTNAPRARSAKALQAHDSANLRYISASGSTLYEVGKASGTLPGSMQVHMQLSARFTGSFVIYISGGSITGRGSATPHGSGRYESFAGTLAVTGGTGRFGHASGTAKLYGVFDRKSYALSIQTAGTLYY